MTRSHQVTAFKGKIVTWKSTHTYLGILFKIGFTQWLHSSITEVSDSMPLKPRYLSVRSRRHLCGPGYAPFTLQTNKQTKNSHSFRAVVFRLFDIKDEPEKYWGSVGVVIHKAADF